MDDIVLQKTAAALVSSQTARILKQVEQLLPRQFLVALKRVIRLLETKLLGNLSNIDIYRSLVEVWTAGKVRFSGLWFLVGSVQYHKIPVVLIVVLLRMA